MASLCWFKIESQKFWHINKNFENGLFMLIHDCRLFLCQTECLRFCIYLRQYQDYWIIGKTWDCSLRWLEMATWRYILVSQLYTRVISLLYFHFHCWEKRERAGAKVDRNTAKNGKSYQFIGLVDPRNQRFNLLSKIVFVLN